MSPAKRHPMPTMLELSHRLSLYLMLGICLLALANVGLEQKALWAALLFAPSALLHTRPRSRRLRQLSNALVLLLVAATAAQMVVGEPLIQPALNFVLALLALKLYMRESCRDLQQIQALAFLLMAVAAVMGASFSYAPLFVAYSLSLCLNLGTNHWMRQSELVADKGQALASELNRMPALSRQGGKQQALHISFAWRDLALLLSSSLILLAFSALLFVLLPRPSWGLGQVDERAPAMGTGFSPQIELGKHGRIHMDERDLLRAYGPALAFRPYWRAQAYDLFDGHRWSVSSSLGRTQVIPRTQNGAGSESSTLAWSMPGSPLAHYRIELQELSSPVLLSLWPTLSVQAPLELRLSPSGAISLAHSPKESITYELTIGDVTSLDELPTQVPLPSSSAAQQLLFDPNIIRRHDLDTHAVSPDIAEIAREIAPSRLGAEERLRRLTHYVMQRHRYTLDLPPSGPDPVAHFLFVSRRGHCELFSSALTLMLRASGIPARNVNGFAGGDYDTTARAWVVKRKHAHSWTEAWLPDRGWVLVDPTPPVAMGSSSDETPSLTFLARLWQHKVLNFSAQEQRNILGIPQSFKELGSSFSLASLWYIFGVHLLPWLALFLGLLLLRTVLLHTRLSWWA
ncbi:MAG: DUF3488 and transglutaminase-like domain-containing protein, partial [Myxococcota bacterium]|nr:DUF3488 and transglutaminase-like domain-containing protein [Myxococcota bacterium]